MTDTKSNSASIGIRLATQADYDGCLAVLMSHHSRTMFAEYAFSESQFRKQFDKALTMGPQSIVLVAERHDTVVGCAWATLGRYALSDELKMTTVQLIAVNSNLLTSMARAKAFSRLLNGVKKWSDAQGADKVLVHVTTGTSLNSAHKLLRASGLTNIGGAYAL
ncbi:MAG: hypothetical protein AAF141_04515 [Pseudomonadota bacterium]